MNMTAFTTNRKESAVQHRSYQEYKESIKGQPDYSETDVTLNLWLMNDRQTESHRMIFSTRDEQQYISWVKELVTRERFDLLSANIERVALDEFYDVLRPSEPSPL